MPGILRTTAAAALLAGSSLPASANVIFDFMQARPTQVIAGTAWGTIPQGMPASLEITDAAFAAGLHVDLAYDAFGDWFVPSTCPIQQVPCQPPNLLPYGIAGIVLYGVPPGVFERLTWDGSVWRWTIQLQSGPGEVPVGRIWTGNGTTGTTWALAGDASYIDYLPPVLAQFHIYADGYVQIPEPPALPLLALALAGLGLARVRRAAPH